MMRRKNHIKLLQNKVAEQEKEIEAIENTLKYHKIYSERAGLLSFSGVYDPIRPRLEILEDTVSKIKNDIRSTLSNCINKECPHYNNEHYLTNCNDNPFGCKKYKGEEK
jgi:hypothetical protein